MNAPKTMDLLAGLRQDVIKSGRATQASVKIEAPAMDVVVDSEFVAEAGCKAIADAIKTSMHEGTNPFTGGALPQLAASTMERRDYREKQAQRNGAANERYRDKAKRRTVRKNWRRRYQATKAGSFEPDPALRDRFGLESGMLVDTLVAVPERGGGWGLYSAYKRSLNDAKGGSAVTRVFGRLMGGGGGGQMLVNNPKMQVAIKRMATAMVVVGLARGLGGLVKTLAKQLPELVEQARETYDIGQDIAEE